LQKTATDRSRRGEKIRRERGTEWWEGVYPAVETKRVCKGMKGKRIGGFLWRNDGSDGWQMY
jgi:hypothetical protein